jgi:hypothetical protein
MSIPTSTAVPIVFATDEDIAVRAADDYVTLCPASNELAVGIDGVISSGTPWTFSGGTVDFEANGVFSQAVIELKGGLAPGSTKPYFAGSGRLFAIDSVAGGTATLRRPGLLPGMGQPPGAGGVTGITFKVATYVPQIELASYDLYQRYGLDVLVPGRFPSDLYDVRELRQLCVLEVLRDRFASAVRTSGDWAEKLKQVAAEMGDVRDRVQLKWGNLGQGDLPSNRLGMTITR